MLNVFQPLDEAITLAIAGWHNPFLDAVLPVFTYLGSGGVLWIALGLVLLIFPRTRKIALVMGAALGLAALVGNLILKPIFARPRPFLVLTGLPETIPRETSYSFPSGHTISSFAAAMVLWFYSWKLALPATAMACVIGFSRIYLFCHFFTDVTAGIILGCASAFLMVLLYHLLLNRRFPLKEPLYLRRQKE